MQHLKLCVSGSTGNWGNVARATTLTGVVAVAGWGSSAVTRFAWFSTLVLSGAGVECASERSVRSWGTAYAQPAHCKNDCSAGLALSFRQANDISTLRLLS